MNTSIAIWPCQSQQQDIAGRLERSLTMRIHDIKRARNSAHNHPDKHKHEEHHRRQPAIPPRVRSRPRKAVHPDAAEQQLREDKDDSKFGLVLAVVPFDHELRGPVGEDSGENEADERSDKGSCVGVSGFDFGEPEWWGHKEDCEGDADEDGPADHDALDETGLVCH